MIIVDSALKQRQKGGNPIQVGLIGAGYMGRGIALQLESSVEGIRAACIYSRDVSKAERAYKDAGIDDYRTVKTVDQLEDAIRKGIHTVTNNPYIVSEAPSVDAIIEATGAIEFGVEMVLQALKNKKHVILMNAELDATVGPLLKLYADKAGVVITNADGDQPGVIMNKFRFAKQIGYEPVLAGNIKGMEDPYRTPATQKAFAEQHRQKPRMVTSFADGTKLSMEMTVVANATGFKAGKRGMYGPKCNHVTETVEKFPLDDLLEGGLVDYVVGAEPGPGIFILGYNEHPIKKQYMKYFKMGDGPLYVFYVPYHLPHLEVPITAARAVIFRDAAITPKYGPVCEVMTIAKKEMEAGEKLDGMGGFTCYGNIDNHAIMKEQNLLPMGLSEGCILRRNVEMDQPITFDDVDVPPHRIIDLLYDIQNRVFSGPIDIDTNFTILDGMQL